MSYIKNSLPKAFSQQKLLEYLKKYQESKQESIRKEIIEHNLRLVSYIASRYVSENISYDDLFSIGTFGLIKSIDKFDISKGNQFATYAARCIENEILMYFRSNKKSQNDVSLNEAIAFDKDDNTLLVEDTLVDENIDIQNDFIISQELIENKAKISNILNYFSERDRFIITKYFGLDDTKPLRHWEIAEILGISQSYVSRICTRCIKKFREEMSKQDVSRRFDYKIINENLNENIFFELLKLLPKKDRILYCKYRGIVLYNKTMLIIDEKEYSNKFLAFMKIIENDINYMFIYYEKLINIRHFRKEIAFDKLKTHMFKHFLRFRFDTYTQKEILTAVKQLPVSYQKVLFLRYGKDLCSFNEFPKNNQNLYNKLNIAHKRLAFVLEKQLEIHPKSIRAKYPDKTLGELKEYIEKLPVNYQKIIYIRNGDNLDKWLPFPKDNSYQSYYNLYSKAEGGLDSVINGVNIIFKEKKNIINSYKRDDLLYAIPRLLLEDQNLVYFVHGKNLDQNNSLPENPPEKAPNYFYQKYIRLFSKIDAILFKRSEIRKNNDFIKNKLSDYTFEEIVDALKELPEEMSNVIIIKHGKNLDEYNPWPNNKPFNYYKNLYNEAIFALKTILKKKKYPEIYEQEQKHITELVEERKIVNQRISKKKRRKTESIIKMFKKEDIIWASEFLSKLQKEILYLRHGENLDRTISWPPIPEGKKANYYSSNYNNMKIRLKYIIEHRSEFIKSLDNKENKKSLSVSIKSKTKVRNVENSIINTVPHDKLLKYAPMLSKIQKEIFYLRHGENLDQVLAWPEIPEGKSPTYYYTNYSFACKNIYKLIEKEEKLAVSTKGENDISVSTKPELDKPKKNIKENSKKQKFEKKRQTYIDAKSKLVQAKLNTFAYSLYKEYNDIYESLLNEKFLKNIIDESIMSYTYEEGLNFEISTRFKVETGILLYLSNIYRENPNNEINLEIQLLIESIFTEKLKKRFGTISKRCLSLAIEKTLEEYNGEKLFSTEVYVRYRKFTQ